MTRILKRQKSEFCMPDDIKYIHYVISLMAMDFVTPLIQIGGQVVSYFLKKGEQQDAIQRISQGDVGEYISRPFVDMHAALIKVDTVLDVYSNLLLLSSEPFRGILEQNHSPEFFRRAKQHMQEFWDNIQRLEGRPNGDKVMESVKGNACAGNARFTTELDAEIKKYGDIKASGGTPTSQDIRNVMLAYHNFTSCFLDGVAAAIEDLAHAGRLLP